VKAFSRVDDKKELEKPTKDSRERIQGARENLTLDKCLPYKKEESPNFEFVRVKSSREKSQGKCKSSFYEKRLV
jgi:hypothetical protein